MPSHFDQASVIKMPFEQIFAAGQQIFVTNFNICDGAGRPGTTGIGTPRTPDPALAPRFTRVSAPDANSCAGCHAQPQPGGAGDFVANVFVLAQALFQFRGSSSMMTSATPGSNAIRSGCSAPGPSRCLGAR